MAKLNVGEKNIAIECEDGRSLILEFGGDYFSFQSKNKEAGKVLAGFESSSNNNKTYSKIVTSNDKGTTLTAEKFTVKSGTKEIVIEKVTTERTIS